MPEQSGRGVPSLTVISPNWLDAKDEAGHRRLHNPDDFVAVEIATAIAHNIRIIHVLIDWAHMPKASELPGSLKPLARRQAVEVRQHHFDQDAAAVAAPAAGPFKVRTVRIAIDFFDELELPLVAGRGFDSRDLEEDAGTIIVNTTFAQRAFGSTNPIGRRVREVTSDRAPVGRWLEIVGVVGHMGVHALTPSQDDGVYLPLAEGDVNPVRLAIWVRGDPAVLAPRVHELAGCRPQCGNRDANPAR